MKLLLADDHALFRDALVHYIERSDLEAKVTIAEDFHQAVDAMREKGKHDLVLLDLRMPGMNGLDGFRRFREQFPETSVALMSGVAEPEDVQQAMDMGASGYFPKTLSGKALLKGIQSVLRGEVFMPLDRRSLGPLPSYYGEAPVETLPIAGLQEQQTPLENVKEAFGLTPREFDVLEYLVTGSSNKDIADALGLQVVTVKLHVRGICRKLDAKNRTQAALIAQEYGLGKEAAGALR